MKPGKTFKLSKTTKRMIGLMKGATADQRNQYKRMMIDAQLCSEIVIKTPTRDKNAPRGNGPTGYQTNDTGTASTSTT
jgi:hypothetical protein